MVLAGWRRYPIGVLLASCARDRAQLVVFTYESGLVRPGWTT
jgi:hypothetical protein